MTPGVSLRQLLRHLVNEVAVSDAQARICQRQGWHDLEALLMETMKETTALAPPTGFQPPNPVQLDEVRFKFKSRTKPPSFLRRFVEAYRYLTKRKTSLFDLNSLALTSTSDADSVDIEVVIRRTPDGRWESKVGANESPLPG